MMPAIRLLTVLLAGITFLPSNGFTYPQRVSLTNSNLHEFIAIKAKVPFFCWVVPGALGTVRHGKLEVGAVWREIKPGYVFRLRQNIGSLGNELKLQKYRRLLKSYRQGKKKCHRGDYSPPPVPTSPASSSITAGTSESSSSSSSAPAFQSSESSSTVSLPEGALYVDNDDGDGLATGCSDLIAPSQNDIAHPFCTIERALSALLIDGTVLVRGGTYFLANSLRVNGRQSFSFRNYPGEEVTLYAEHSENSILELENCSDATVQGLHLTNWAGYAALSIKSSSAITLEDLRIHNSNPVGSGVPGYDKRNGLSIRSSQDVLVRASEFDRLLGNGILSRQGASEIKIEQCYIHDIGENDAQGELTGNSDGINSYDTVSLTVRRCVIDNIGDSALDLTGDATVIGNVLSRSGKDGAGIKLWNGRHMLRDNLIHRNRATGVVVSARQEVATLTHAEIYHNTFYKNKINLWLGSQGGLSQGVTAFAINNVFSFPNNWDIFPPRSGSHRNIEAKLSNCAAAPAYACLLGTEESNLYFNDLGGGIVYLDDGRPYDTDQAILHDWPADYGMGQFIQVGDPVFTDAMEPEVVTQLHHPAFATAPGFVLNQGSPARDSAQFLESIDCQSADDDPDSPMPAAADCHHWTLPAPDRGAYEAR